MTFERWKISNKHTYQYSDKLEKFTFKHVEATLSLSGFKENKGKKKKNKLTRPSDNEDVNWCGLLSFYVLGSGWSWVRAAYCPGILTTRVARGSLIPNGHFNLSYFFTITFFFFFFTCFSFSVPSKDFTQNCIPRWYSLNPYLNYLHIRHHIKS